MVAACLVVLTHSTFFASERLDHKFPVWEQGTRGVDVFFVISGFVMIYSSQKLLALSRGWRVFAEHRILRIVPLYWLVTTLKVVLLLLVAGLSLHARLTPVTIVCSYLFLPSRNLDGKLWPLVSQGWMLQFEMLFYFLFTCALYFRTNVYKFIGIILGVLSIGAYFSQPTWTPVAFYLNSVVLEFFFGMLIAKACIADVYVPRKLAFLLLALGFILLLLPPNDWNLPKALIGGVPASLIVWSAASLGSMENLIPRFILYLGDASYSIYLIHTFVCPIPPAVLSRLHMDFPWLSVILSVSIGVTAGCILHQMIEVPMTKRLKEYLKVRHRSLQAVA
jgi:peptidoglycan/LPS O-acetylase OafA/YrhL